MRLAPWLRGMLLAAVLTPLACAPPAQKMKDAKKPSAPAKLVKVDDIVEGTGPTAENGDWVEIHYTGSLEDGTVFDSSVGKQETLEFQVGRGGVIPGMSKGVLGMKEGGKRKITIPPDLGYGERGAPPVIPANATLIFEIDLMKVKK